MKRLLPLFLLAFLILPLSASAQDQMYQKFKQANELYSAGDYPGALREYLTIEENGFHSGELYYNIGNTYYKLQVLGEALLYYERALKFLAMDDDLLTNIQLANLSIVDKITPIPELFYQKYWISLKYSFSLSSWRFLGFLFYFGLGIWTSLWILIKIRFLRNIFKPALFILLLGIFLSFLVVISIQENWNSHDTGIVMAEEVQVRASPAEDGTGLFALHEGTKVWIKRQSGEWVEIRIADGKTGWLPEKSMKII